MKKRLHDKKAGIAILISIIIISLIDEISRIFLGAEAISSPNMGEALLAIIFASFILIMGAKGKDRLCYLCYAAWGSYFVINELFQLPGMFASFGPAVIEHGFFNMGNIGFLLHILSGFGIVVIGALILEYMHDGTIYNRAFNIACIFTALTIVGSIVVNIINFVQGMPPAIWLAIFNNLYRITMVCMFTFFAYDSAKAQLKKTDFTK